MELGEDVTVGISTYGHCPTTLTALQSLFLAARGNFELLLIDNHSPDEAVRDLIRQARLEHPNTTSFFYSENREYSGAVNGILSHARGQWVIFLSNDIFVTPDYLREIMAAVRANPRHGIVRGCSNFVDNKKPSHNVQLSRAPTTFEDLFAVGKTVAAQYPREPIIDEFFVGDAFVVSRAVLDRIGTYDPAFFGYFADPDFGLRTQISGFEHVLVPSAFAYHQREANFNCLPQVARDEKLAERWRLVDLNWNRFRAKYGLPADEPYSSISQVPWQALRSVPFDPAKHYSAPGDYSADRLP